MMEFSLWKQLKKRLRRGRRRRIIPLGCIAFLVLISQYAGTGSVTAADGQSAADEEWRSRLEKRQGLQPVLLRKIYYCGDESSTLGYKTVDEIIKLKQAHPDWEIVLADETVILEAQIDDLAENCKGNIFISLDKSGNLTLFDGPPKQEKVIRTFFQLDVEYLESNLPREHVEQLNQGIPIYDRDDYLSVLSTFSDYAVERSEKVMKMKE